MFFHFRADQDKIIGSGLDTLIHICPDKYTFTPVDSSSHFYCVLPALP
jgi:hypothetical protein